MNIIRVSINRKNFKINRLWTYQVDDMQYETLQIGSSVFVEFNKSKVLAFVVEKEIINNTRNYKSIIKIIDTTLLSNSQIELFKYMQDNIFASNWDLFKLLLPNKVRKHLLSGDEEKSIIQRKKLGYRYKKKKSFDILNEKHKQLLSVFEKQEEFSSSQLQEYGFNTYLINKLVKLGLLEKIELDYDYIIKFDLLNKKDITLSNDQVNVINEIENNDITLLHGVTGSGKTEVYLELIKSIIKKDKQVLFLVPEITLVMYFVDRLVNLYGNKVIYIHSKLSENQYYNYYNKVKNNEAKIIIGTRSSVFLPYNDLGLIIMDEEHDNSYKNTSMPYYNTKDIIDFYIKYFKLKVVYGSATPSILSYAKVKKGLYGYSVLDKRYHNSALPNIEIEDLFDYSRIFDQNTINKINDAISSGNKVIVLYNRLGFANSISCNNCGHVPKCSNCNVAYSYLKEKNTLFCRYCSEKKRLINNCIICNESNNFEYIGIGVEQVYEYVKENLYNNALYLDGTMSKTKIKKVLKEFNDDSNQVLIGTQIISKGLDFEKVSLVIAANIDSLLYSNDIYANEKVFQMLVQVAGRCGRDGTNSEVIIKTKHKNNELFNYVKNYNYEGFFDYEMENRLLSRTTPYFNVSYVELRCENNMFLEKYTNKVYNYLKKNNLYLSPINKPYIDRIFNKSRYTFMIKYKKEDIITYLNWIKKDARDNGVELIVDLKL